MRFVLKICLQLCVPMAYLHICVVPQRCLVPKDQERVLDSLELEIRMVVTHHLGAGTKCVSSSRAASVSPLP